MRERVRRRGVEEIINVSKNGLNWVMMMALGTVLWCTVKARNDSQAEHSIS